MKRYNGSRGVAIIDIDGCVFDAGDAVACHREMQALPPLPTPQSWNWDEYNEEDREWMRNIYRTPSYYASGKPLPYVKNGLWFLHQHYNIVFLTARAWNTEREQLDQNIANVTADWLRNWEMPPHDLVHCEMGEKGEAASTLYGEMVAFAVEDSPAATKSFVDAGIYTYVIGYPYNSMHQNSPFIKRVSTFNEICEHRIKIERLSTTGQHYE